MIKHKHNFIYVKTRSKMGNVCNNDNTTRKEANLNRDENDNPFENNTSQEF